MKQQIYKYQLWLMGDKNEAGSGYSYDLTQDEGQRLMMMLSNKDCPKFVIIQEEMINVNSIRKLEKTKSFTQGIRRYQTKEYDNFPEKDKNGNLKMKIVDREEWGSILEIRELTENEIETQKAFEEFCGKNRELKLLK